MHDLEQLVHCSTHIEFITSLPGQIPDIDSPDKLSDQNIVAGTLKVVIPPIKETSEKGVFKSKR